MKQSLSVKSWNSTETRIATRRVKHSKERNSLVKEVKEDSRKDFEEQRRVTRTSEREQLKYKHRHLGLVKYCRRLMFRDTYLQEHHILTSKTKASCSNLLPSKLCSKSSPQHSMSSPHCSSHTWYTIMSVVLIALLPSPRMPCIPCPHSLVACQNSLYFKANIKRYSSVRDFLVISVR